MLQMGIVICLVIVGVELLSLGLRRCVNSAVYPVGYKQRYLVKHFLMALFRYIVDALCKLGILGVSFGALWLIYSNYNWFKSAINLGCADSNPTTLKNILVPYMNIYSKLLYYYIGILAVTGAMIIIDIIHFVYIYKAELSYYLIQTESKAMVKKDEEEDLKWMEIKDLDKEGGQENDEFRITMAQNIFSRDTLEIEPQPAKLKKKKKKRLFNRKANDE